nr:outer membrane protein transport protein [Anabaena catenula]
MTHPTRDLTTGNAFAGSAAIANDASTIFFNPGGLTRLTGNSAIGATYAIIPTVRLKNQGSRVVTGAPLSGGDGGDAGVWRELPTF